MRIFITGGTGFIGKPLVKLLRKNGHKLLVLSRRAPSSELAKLASFAKGDLANAVFWRRRINKFKPQAAIFLAWEGIPDYSVATSIKNLKYNLDLTEEIARIGCRIILAVGTCWEYGKKDGRLREDIVAEPLNFFALAKDSFRRLSLKIAEENNARFIWLRLFFVYGPGQRENSLIPYILKSLQSGKKPDIKNSSAQQDFIYVDDAARAISDVLSKSKNSGIYNIGSGRLTSVRRVLKLIYDSYGLKSKDFSEKKQAGLYADISKIKKETGWEPEIDIKTGIKKTIEYFKSR